MQTYSGHHIFGRAAMHGAAFISTSELLVSIHYHYIPYLINHMLPNIHINDMCHLLHIMTRNKGKQITNGRIQNQDNSHLQLWISQVFQHKLAQQNMQLRRRPCEI